MGGNEKAETIQGVRCEVHRDGSEKLVLFLARSRGKRQGTVKIRVGEKWADGKKVLINTSVDKTPVNRNR